MKKTLNKEHLLYFTPFFPKKNSVESDKQHTVIVGIGGNIGKVKQTFHKLYLMLLEDREFEFMQSSPILKNPAFGYTNQNDFFNAVLALKTNLSPMQVLHRMQRYEKRFKRKRSFKDAPRTLDLDIIFYDDKKINTQNLIIPHPHWYKRQSVLIPLGYIV